MNILTAKDILENYDDFGEVSSWAVLSVGFCVKEGIAEPDSNSINPKITVSRETIAVMLYRMLGKANLL